MKVPGAHVVHVLRMPAAKEMQDHERASTSVVAARRSIETRAVLEPSGALYDKLHRPGITAPDSPEGPGGRFLIRSALRQSTLCGKEEDCPDRLFRCRQCGYSQHTELDDCPARGAGWKAIDVRHDRASPKHLVEEAFDTPKGILVRRCFRLVNMKSMGLAITLADITEEELRVMEWIEAARQEQASDEDIRTPRASRNS